MLGPLERIFIVSLGLAGSLTAAALVIAAKGLLRYPELRHSEDRVSAVSEYFLIGSFTSWLVALAGLACAAYVRNFDPELWGNAAWFPT